MHIGLRGRRVSWGGVSLGLGRRGSSCIMMTYLNTRIQLARWTPIVLTMFVMERILIWDFFEVDPE